MNLLQLLKNTWLGQKNDSQTPQFSTLIEDRLPASTLLGEQRAFITEATCYGNIPITLTKDTCINFSLTPNSDVITGIRLRFGTYCRANRCHVTVQINDVAHRFNTSYLVDNEYVDIPFSALQMSKSGQAVAISIYSEDAAEDNVVALWCSRIPPTFIQALDLKSIAFPKVISPRVSIIIPVFNKVLYTYNCLLTLLACDTEISQEIIIVNNASTDETAALSAQGTFHIINNLENQGFVQACRQGAEIANGEFVLFLNNDTQVMPGWLSNMIKIMEADPTVGITGSKLIYPDGRLQEAGGIIFNDASGWNYGRLQDPTLPQFNQSRAVDYCSGASLMIRKSLWELLGGFDMRYAPAYYEDTDLCFAARQAGYKVFYCHESEVIHHEGVTAGTDINSGYKAFQAINHDKFREKWQAVLATHYPPGTPPEQAIERLSQSDYQSRIAKEIDNYKQVENVHDLPEIAHYWSNKYLLPIVSQFGFANAEEFYCLYIQRICQAFSIGSSENEVCHLISIGAGNCDIEIKLVEMLLDKGLEHFTLECLDINQAMLDRGLASAQQLASKMQFTCSDINGWQPKQQYHIVIANQSLHHFVELELLFDKIDHALHPQGYFLTHDMIGRNGHQRWPEALEIVNELWATLPERYKYNHLLKRVELEEYENWDCATESFEGIRAQDILPLLVEKFSFDLFLAYANVIDIFIDRCFGHNFDANDPHDQAFIDKVHQIDQSAIEEGRIKPTHITAAMTKKSLNTQARSYKELTPEFCIRWANLN